MRFAPLIPPGEVLDLACGSGRHARLLAALGHPVLAVDRDEAALASARGAGIETLCFDLERGEPWPFAPRRFAGIVVTNYLHRPLFPGLLESIAPGGMLIYETFAAGNERFGRPARAEFLLGRGELLDLLRAADWQVAAFEDGQVSHPRPAVIQRICALRRPAAASEWAELET